MVANYCPRPTRKYIITRNFSQFERIPQQNRGDSDTDNNDQSTTEKNQDQIGNTNGQLPSIIRRSNRVRKAAQRYGQPLS